LAKAHSLKEKLRQIWNQPKKASAVAYLEQRVSSALNSDVGPLVKRDKNMAMYRVDIVA